MADIKNNEEFKVTDKTIKEDLENLDKNFEGLRERIMQAPPLVVATAYIYAMNMIRYNVDVTEPFMAAETYSKSFNTAYKAGYDAGYKAAQEASEDDRK